MDAKTDALFSGYNPKTRGMVSLIIDRPQVGWFFVRSDGRFLDSRFYWFAREDKRTDYFHTRHHAAMVWDGKEVLLFVDGEPHKSGETHGDAEKTPPPAEYVPPSTDRFYLGAGIALDGKTLTRFFRGTIDAVRVSRGSRYLRKFQPPQRFAKEDGTIALYQCDEATGNVLHDSSGNGYDGKIVGARWVVSSTEQRRIALEKLLAIGAGLHVLDPQGQPMTLQAGNVPSLAGCRVSQIGLGIPQLTDEMLAESLPHLPDLDWLRIGGSTSVSDRAVDSILDCKRLAYIELNDTAVTGAGVERCLQLPLFHLGIARAQLTASVIDRIREKPSLAALVVSHGNPELFEAVCDVSQLNVLEWHNSKITSDGLRKLVANCKDLSSLNLPVTNVTDDDLQAIGQASKLVYLTLYETQITDAGIKHLAKLKNLKQIRIQRTKITKEGAEWLKQQLPNCAVEHFVD